MESNVLISLISAGSALGVAYIVNVAAKRVQVAKAKKQPKDRMEQVVVRYEQFIQRLDAEIERKQKYIDIIERELKITKQELERERMGSLDLKRELDQFRSEIESLRNSPTPVEGSQNGR